MSTLKLISGVVLALLIIIVVLQNTEPVHTKLLFFTLSMPRAVLLMITWLVGVAVGMLFSLTFASKKGAKRGSAGSGRGS